MTYLSLGIFMVVCIGVFIASEFLFDVTSVSNKIITLITAVLLLLIGGYFLTTYSGGKIGWNEVVFSEIVAISILNVSALTFVILSRYANYHWYEPSLINWSIGLTVLILVSYFCFTMSFFLTIIGVFVIYELIALLLLGVRKLRNI